MLNRQITIKIFFTALLLLLCNTHAVAQKKGYYQGYIVTLSNDTIRGHVQDRDEGIFEELYKRIKFVPLGKRWKKKYSPQDIKGYGYLQNAFESVPLEEEMQLFILRYYTNHSSPKIFLKVIQRNDVLTHYQQEFIDQDNNTIQHFPLFYKHGTNQMVRVTQGILGLKRKRLKEYFHDCPALVSAINDNEVTRLQEVFDYYSLQCW